MGVPVAKKKPTEGTPPEKPPVETFATLLKKHFEEDGVEVSVAAEMVGMDAVQLQAILEGTGDPVVSFPQAITLLQIVNLEPARVLFAPSAPVSLGKPTFGGLVRGLRREARMTQDELAARSGISKGAIVQLEAGRRTPTLATAAKLAKALGTNLSVFAEVDFGEEGES